MADISHSINLPNFSRPILEAEIERLIGLLDTMDEDPDLEPEGNDEPSLGATERQSGSWKGLSAMCDDREEDSEDEGAQCEDEGNDSGDREPELSGFNCAWGPCSPIETLLGQQ